MRTFQALPLAGQLRGPYDRLDEQRRMPSDEAPVWQDPQRKAAYVRDMFAGVAERYDLLNTILSFSRHRAWRRAAVRLAQVQPGECALDVCTGTGDFALDLRRAVGSAGFVAGVDFCEPMVRLGRQKVVAGTVDRVGLLVGDAIRLPVRSESFDVVTVGFGVRNVTDITAAFREMARAARPGGRVVCLEFSVPRSRLWRPVVQLYQTRVLPCIGGMLSRREAYTYLPESIQAFSSPGELVRIMEGVGLRDVRVRELNFGSVSIHVGRKV